MKTALLASLAVLSLSSAPAFGEEPLPADHPCRKIEEACKAAGFVRGEANVGKGLFKNCLGPILDGKPVAGVNVDPSLGAACKQRQVEARKQHAKAP